MAIAGTAYAGEQTVFGFKLDAPLDLPQCHGKPISGSDVIVYEFPAAVTCAEVAHTVRGYPAPIRRIDFSSSDAPTIVKNNQMLALEQDGKLIGVQFYTLGVSAQEITLQQLTTKYGKPSTSNTSEVKNLAGASFQSVSAKWTLPDVIVTFEGTLDQFDRGRVTIDTPLAAQIRDSWGTDKPTGRRL